MGATLNPLRQNRLSLRGTLVPVARRDILTQNEQKSTQIGRSLESEYVVCNRPSQTGNRRFLRGNNLDVSIRKYRESDATNFYEAVLESVDHLSEWLPWCSADYSISAALEWTKSAARTWEDGIDYRFLIEDSKTGKVLGSVGISQIIRQHKVGNLGYWVRKSAINQGVCTSAARQTVLFAFENLDFKRIEIHVQVENSASNAVASRLGGHYEGTFRNKLIFNGKSVPAKCYSIIPSDYGV